MRFLSHSLTVASSLTAAMLASSALSAEAAPKVIASIVPVHALVAGVMDGVGSPDLLLSGQTSEHQASYSPQQIQALGEADLVFIIGHGLELKLDELSGSEAVKGRTFFELADVDGLSKLPIRQGGAFEEHVHHEGDDHDEEGKKEAGHGEHDHEEAGQAEDGHDEHEHGKAAFDPHLWLDPVNAQVMVAAIAGQLSKADPANAERYAANAAALGKGLGGLSEELAKELEPLKNKPFVVYHDAYQYFEARFGLSAAGSISDLSGNEPSAQRLKEVRDKLKAVNAVCVFREPQFSDKAAKTVIEGTSARDGVLDPLGSGLSPGKDAYGVLLRGLAKNLKSCLAG
ncbi:MAG: zinc ABC transporter solute-binding protein [Phyllobacteriaceae bacterium]|nr:zinc ABC transporter solute-binding protein [Phyllobacteriaceae bacterium]